MFAKVDTSVDKTLSCPALKLSNSKISLLDGVETGVLLSNSAQQLRGRNADVPDFILLYLTLLEHLQLWFWISMPQRKRDEVESLSKKETSKNERQKKVHAGCHCLWTCVQFSET